MIVFILTLSPEAIAGAPTNANAAAIEMKKPIQTMNGSFFFNTTLTNSSENTG